MQSIQIQVSDQHIQSVLTLLNSLKDGMIEKLEVRSDPHLAYDPYFYERRESLHKLREDVRSGDETLIPHDLFWEEIEQAMMER